MKTFLLQLILATASFGLPCIRALEVIRNAARGSVIEGSYIVQLKSKSSSAKTDVMRLAGDSTAFEYSNVFDGFSVKSISNNNLQNILDSPDVEAVHEVRHVHLCDSFVVSPPW